MTTVLNTTTLALSSLLASPTSTEEPTGGILIGFIIILILALLIFAGIVYVSYLDQRENEELEKRRRNIIATTFTNENPIIVAVFGKGKKGNPTIDENMVIGALIDCGAKVITLEDREKHYADLCDGRIPTELKIREGSFILVAMTWIDNTGCCNIGYKLLRNGGGKSEIIYARNWELRAFENLVEQIAQIADRLIGLED